MFQSGALQMSLDFLMIVLLIIASYALIFQEIKYRYFIIFIFIGYIYYLIKYRLNYTNQKSNRPVYHQLPKKKVTTFKEDYLKGIQERSQISYIKSADKLDRQNSYINRSIRADSSSRITRLNEQNLKDFTFINKQKQKKLIRESFIKNNKGMNDTYLLNVRSNQERRHDRQSNMQSKIEQCTKKYHQTLDSLNISNAQYLYDGVKLLCKSFCQQLYEEHLNNLHQIIQVLEQLYDIRINCRGFIELQKRLGERKLFKGYQFEINFQEVLQKLMKSKGKQLNYPQRKVNYNLYHNLRERSIQSITTVDMLLEATRKKLDKLIIEQFRLNSYFCDEKKHLLSAVQAIIKVKSLGQQMNRPQYDSEIDSIPQQQSQKLLLVFNITRNKINDIVDDNKKALLFNKKSIMGWIKNQTSIYSIKETLNSDYGHPHFDLRVQYPSQKQDYNCQYGVNNGYSLIYMYLMALKKHEINLIHEKKVLINIIKKCCQEA